MKGIIYVVFISFFIVLANESRGQNIHPEVQAKIDSLQSWIQQELATSGTIDTAKLAEWNERIRAEQKRLATETDETASPSASSNARTEKFSGYAGASFTVPDGKKWKVKRVTVSQGMGEYSVLVTSVKFDQEYAAGDVISTPAFTSEGALLTEDQSTVMYTFEIMEFDVE